MQLHRALGAAELRPIVKFQTEINDAGIQTDQLVFEAKSRLPCAGLRPATLQHLEKDSLINFPGSMLIGVGQGRFRRSLAQAQMLELAFGGCQSLGDFTQAVGSPQLANSMAMNCPQQVKPRACRSALCWWTADWNSVRENSWRIWLKILHTTFMVDAFLVRKWSYQGPSPYQRLHLFHARSTVIAGGFSKSNLDESDRKYKMKNLTLRLP